MTKKTNLGAARELREHTGRHSELVRVVVGRAWPSDTHQGPRGAMRCQNRSVCMRGEELTFDAAVGAQTAHKIGARADLVK